MQIHLLPQQLNFVEKGLQGLKSSVSPLYMNAFDDPCLLHTPDISASISES